MSELSKIMYVEDQPDIQMVAKVALESVGGFEVLICSGGEEALEKVKDFNPQLILLDVMMPGIVKIGDPQNSADLEKPLRNGNGHNDADKIRNQTDRHKITGFPDTDGAKINGQHIKSGFGAAHDYG